MSGCCCCRLNLLLLLTPTWLFHKVNVVIGDAGFVNQWERIWCVLRGVRLMYGVGTMRLHPYHGFQDHANPTGFDSRGFRQVNHGFLQNLTWVVLPFHAVKHLPDLQLSPAAIKEE